MTKTTKKQTKKQTPKAAKAATTPKPKVVPPGPGEIAINMTKDGKVTKINVPAERVGDYFAVHDPQSGGGRVLTHVPTGMQVGRYRTRALALWVGLQLTAATNGNAKLWDFTKPDHLAKFADKALLAKFRELADPASAEALMKAASPAQVPTGPKVRASIPGPAPTQAWRSSVDWVAAGKKAYETRMRNLAAKQAAAVPAPAPVKAPLSQPAPIAAPRAAKRAGARK